ncbi:hypothetical protein [Enterovibrio norvegicus]|uniref:Uncharacterized protein n=1 Tax=Enterovibrio norvegicus DSM 15893 TaxID=1121869 RepID=A0A1I5T4T9_9GAMM|nr:hypothetical protein [Enterovibrio norvegicus]SFP78064.1 hypothetical protein SAMN03084138_03095 [Enterovibrio norvegicus DSM 15893]
MSEGTRFVVGVLGESWSGNDEQDWFGLLDISFEKFDNNGEAEFCPINKKAYTVRVKKRL